LPKFFDFKARTIVVLDNFNSWELSFVDPVHEFPWAMTFVGNFLNFLVKE